MNKFKKYFLFVMSIANVKNRNDRMDFKEIFVI